MNFAPSFNRLRAFRLPLVRGLWLLLCAAAVVIFGVGAVEQAASPLPSCIASPDECSTWGIYREDIAQAASLGISPQLLVLLGTAGQWLPRLIWFGMGLLLFWRRSHDRMAWLVSLTLTLFLFEGMYIPGPLSRPAAMLYALAVFLFFLLPFVFPNGRFVPGWMGWVAVPLNLFISLGSLLPRPEEGGTASLLIGVVASLLWVCLAGYAVFYRYRHTSAGLERQQIKWMMTGILGWAIALAPPLIALIYFPALQPSPQRLVFLFGVMLPVYILSYLITALCMGTAIFRYRLWDIDLIIRRTLQYTALTALLALVYFGAVVLLQTIFGAFAGAQSPAVIVLSTLFIAALFTPLRRRVQALIDRRFYRQKYDSQQVLARFAAAARDETNLDNLTLALSGALQETMQPEGIHIWLKR